MMLQSYLPQNLVVVLINLKRFHIILLLLLIGGRAISQTDSRTIIGVVTVEGEQTVLDGAVVRVKGTDNYTGTQPDGVFYLSVKPTDSLLVCSFEGFNTREIRITDEAEYHIPLSRKKDNTKLLHRFQQ